ncbi:ATP-binding cassette domain-containing protein [Halobacillus litoralis]|uniref:ATP-binding cassette domain-containing protein n=1 Tax=Halobacillus litoralis TaxID=45668 RepID=A0A845F6N7_9BACI|nr:ABC transporter ATP-binding protein [Halobacillus litoralis]MYL69474.1 ATP-binding cassette domain-containing protein [Halobacillus litoralis]
MRTIFSYTFPYKRSASIALLLMFIELLVELAQPILMAKIIDEGIIAEDFNAVLIWGCVLLGLSLIAFTAGVTNSFFAADLSQGVGYDLRNDLFAKVQEFSARHFQNVTTPSLVTRITNDVIQIQNLLFMFVRIGLRAPLFIIFALVMAFTIDVELALLLLSSVPVFLLFLFFLLTKGIKWFKVVQQRLDGLNTIIRENIAGIRLIKGFNRKEQEEKRFQQANESLVLQNKKALWLMEVAMPVVMFGMNIVILVLLFAGSQILRNAGLDAGELVAIINYATRILFTFSVFTFLIMVISRGQASAERITEVLHQHTDEDTSGEDKELEGAVRFRNVSLQRGGYTVLRDLNFHALPGTTVGIIGETGAGKTSLLHLIPRLYEKNAGQLFLDGVDIENLHVKKIRKQISLVPQEVHLFSGTVKENISWGKRDATYAEVVKAAKQAQIHDFIAALPNGYETQIGQKGVVFSGGQKQRLSIARALVRQPRILILDDSTSALDAHTEKRLLRSLDDQPCTVFLVAQKVSSIQKADLILILHQGEIIAQGTHDELLQQSEYYAEIHQSQQEGVTS